MTLSPGVRVGQTWQSRKPKQGLPWLRITSIDYCYVDGRLTAERDGDHGRNTRVLRNQLEQRYQLVAEAGGV